ncbi:chromophore lyase CpcT/CpeT [Nostoc sp. CHAB 5824]|nr:chromophore lyase CpcT/CpeT [Nostoc sp. CHAB 5824]
MHIETYEQIWESTTGPLRFEKRESFADELCAVSALC